MGHFDMLCTLTRTTIEGGDPVVALVSSSPLGRAREMAENLGRWRRILEVCAPEKRQELLQRPSELRLVSGVYDSYGCLVEHDLPDAAVAYDPGDATDDRPRFAYMHAGAFERAVAYAQSRIEEGDRIDRELLGEGQDAWRPDPASETEQIYALLVFAARAGCDLRGSWWGQQDLDDEQLGWFECRHALEGEALSRQRTEVNDMDDEPSKHTPGEAGHG